MDLNITQREGIKKCLYEDLKKMYDAFILSDSDRDKVESVFNEFLNKCERYI